MEEPRDQETPPADAPLGPASGGPHALAGAGADGRQIAAALAMVFEQQSRDAAANRAQARELIRAVEGLAQAHEFLGKELRDERRRSRALVAAVVLAPLLVAGLAAWVVWRDDGTDRRLEELRASVGEDLRTLRVTRDAEHEAALRADFESRVQQSESDRAALRGDLEAVRRALADEQRGREERDRTVTARLTEAERDRADLAGARAELTSAREVAGAERARADELARLLAAAAAARTPPSDARPATATDGAAAPSSSDVGPPAAPRAEAPAPPRTDPTAVRDPEDLSRIRAKLNELLRGATGAIRYEIEALSAVAGTDLLGVRVVARDEAGTVVRTVEGGRAEIRVASDGGVRVRFTDGRLLVGGREAPFFDGSYTLVVGGAAEPWRTSGLPCVRLD